MIHLERSLCSTLFFVLALALPAHADVGSRRLSLPKGPGSTEGLGAVDLAPSLSSGQANYSIPIEVPPGARGFGPTLALDYDSGAGIGEMGLGWRLSGVPSVGRRLQEGLPQFDETDAFEVIGLGRPSELLEVEPGIYRPQHEDGSFLRAERVGDEWEVRTKAGTVLRFGGPGHVAEEGENVASYLLESVQDRRGHEVRYEWRVDGGYPLLERVVWNDFGAEHRNEVRFEYQSRPDRARLFHLGIRQELTERLVSITVEHGGALVRRYELSYSDHSHPRLSAISLVGADSVSRLPTVEFRYTDAALPAVGGAAIVEMTRAPGGSPADGDTTLADLDGDGLPDLLVGRAGAYRSFVNVDGAAWESPVDWTTSASPSLSLSSTGVQMADLDGDGSLDLLISGGPGGPRYLRSLAAGAFGDERQLLGELGFSFEDPNVRLADMDGDRRIDGLMTTPTGLVLVRNEGGTAFLPATTPRAIDAKQEVLFENPGTDLCDLNGDRLPDICVLRSGALVYYLGRGRGVFEPAAEGSGVPEFDADDPFVLKDLDGDGWDDLVRVGVAQVTYALACGEGRFGAIQSLLDVPTRSASTYSTFADMNGSGSLDIVWVDVVGSGERAWRYLELFPAGRAGLLTEIDSGTGKKQTIEYASAASFAAKQRQQGNAWTSRMNLAMPVVARVTVDSGVGDPLLVRDYQYDQGTYNPAERTFAAFGSTTTISRGDEWTPTLVVERTFDVGLERPWLRGAVLVEESRAQDGRIFSRLSHTYVDRALETAPDGRVVSYGYRGATLTELIEGATDGAAGDSGDGTIVTFVEKEQDEFGNVVAEFDWGRIDGEDYLVGDDEAITMRTFANDALEWALGHPSSETLRDAAGRVAASSRRYYDGQPFVGLPSGEVTRGDLTREEAWVGPGEDDYVLVTGTRYDDHGLPVETKDARGGGRFFSWDRAHTSLIGEGVKLEEADEPSALLLEERAVVDGRFGTLLEVRAYSGATTRYEYDVFGRLTTVVQPGDSAALPTLRYTYEDAAPLSRIITEARIESGSEAVELREDVFDGQGRKRASFVLDAELWLMAGVSLYDARGEVRRQLLPRWVSEHERKSPPLTEDGDGRTAWRDALGREVRTESTEGVVDRTEYLPLRTIHWQGASADAEAERDVTPLTTVFDGRGRIVLHERTASEEVLSASYTYDAAGRLLRRMDPDGLEQRFRFDGRGRRIEVDDPNQGLHRFTYDDSGNLLVHEAPGGARTRSTYDLADRQLTEDWDDDDEPEILREYDLGPSENLGKLVRVTEPSGFVHHSYDERGLVKETVHRIEGRDHRVRSRFDAQGREIEHEYPDGTHIALRRNARGQLSGYGELFRIEYEARGSEAMRRYSTGAELRKNYDRDGRLAELQFLSADGAGVEHLTFDYDARGDLVGRFDERVDVEVDSDRSEAYTYDELGRLTGVSSSWGSSEFRYSAAGSLIERRSTVPSQDAGRIRYEGRNQAPASVGGRAIVLDARGRMTDDGLRSYVWDEASHLISVSSGSARVDSVYGQDGVRRVRRETSSSGQRTETHFIDAWSEVKDGRLVRYVVHAGERVVRLADGPRVREASPARSLRSSQPHASGLRWGVLVSLLAALIAAWMMVRPLGAAARSRRTFPLLGSCALLAGLLAGCSDGPPAPEQAVRELVAGDVLLVTDQVGSLLASTNERGEPDASLRLSPYGHTVEGDSTETHQFAGTPRDLSIDLDHMGARFYAPDLGMWTSPDPVGLFEPERQITGEFAAAHSYAYANLQPTTAVDRDGHYWQRLIGTGIGIAAGAGGEMARQYIQTGTVQDWGRVGAMAAGGAVVGYLASQVPIATMLPTAFSGGVGVVAVRTATRLIESGGRNAGTLTEIATDFAVGAVCAVLTKGAGTVVETVIKRYSVQAPVVTRAAAGADDVASAGGRGLAVGQQTEAQRSLAALPLGVAPSSQGFGSGDEETPAWLEGRTVPSGDVDDRAAESGMSLGGSWHVGVGPGGITGLWFEGL